MNTKGVYITFDSQETEMQARQEAMQVLRKHIQPGSIVYCKVIHKGKSTLAHHTRGYALLVPYLKAEYTPDSTEVKYTPAIYHASWDVSLVTGCKVVNDEPQHMLPLGKESIQNVVKNLSSLLFDNNALLQCEVII